MSQPPHAPPIAEDNAVLKTSTVIGLFQTFLAPELRALGQEAKRRHPPLKDACERAVAKIGALDSDPTTPQELLELLRYCEEFWRPLLIACDCKGGKMPYVAVSALQRLLSHGLILQPTISSIVAALTKLKECDEAVQLKVLQCVMALFSSSSGYELTSSQIPCVLTLAFTMYLQKNQTVQSTAAATLNQVTGALFDRILSPSASRTSGPDTLSRTKGAFLLLKDLCHLAAGEPGTCIKLEEDIPKTFLFDLLYSIVFDHASAISSQPQFIGLVKEDVSLVLAQTLQSDSEPQTLARVYRIVTVMIQKFPYDLISQQERFLSLMMHTVEQPDAPGWQRVVVLISWRDLADNYFYLKKLYSCFDASPKQRVKLFEVLVATVCNTITKLPPAQLSSVSMSAERTTFQKILSCRQDEEIVVGPSEVAAWAIDVVVAFCKSLSKLVEVEGRPLTDGELENDVKELEGDNLSFSMLNAVWARVLTTCTLLLEKSQDEEILEETLRCFKQFIHACGKAKLVDARDAFLSVINRHTIPLQGSLTPKNMQVLRVVFDVASGLGGVLGSSWYLILVNFQQLDDILTANSTEQNRQSDVALIQALLSKVFDGTKYFESDTLLTVADALCKLSTETAEMYQESASPQAQPRACSPFAVDRMADMAVANSLRLHVLWDVLFQHLTWLMQDSECDMLRKAAVKAVSNIILSYLLQCRIMQSPPGTPSSGPAPDPSTMTVPPTLLLRKREGASLSRSLHSTTGKHPSSPWAQGPPPAAFWELQPKVVDLLRIMKSSERTDVRIGCLNLLFTMLERHGQELAPTSWRLILNILTSSCHVLSDLPVAFKCVDFIQKDFMPVLDRDALQALVSCVGQFALQAASTDRHTHNANLTAIQQWALTVIDYCSSHPERELGPHLNSIFVQLRDTAVDVRPVVRDAAMKTLFTAVAAHGNNLPLSCWDTLFWDVLLKLLDTVHSQALVSEQANQELIGGHNLLTHHSRDTAAKQWYETRRVALDGVARLLRVFYPVTARCVTKFDEVLGRLAIHLANACLYPIEEVAAEGLRSLHALLIDISNSAKPEHRSHPMVLWEVAWKTWERIADAALVAPLPVFTSAEDAPVSCEAVHAVADGLAEMYQTMHSNTRNSENLRTYVLAFSDRLLPLLEKIMNCPAAREAPQYPSRLQTCVLKCLQSQPVPADDEALQLEQIKLLCSFLPAPELIADCMTNPATVPKQLTHGEVPLTERVLQVLQVSYCVDTVPDSVRRSSFTMLLKRFEPILMSRYFPQEQYQMWEGAVAILPNIFRHALPTYSRGDAETKAMWSVLHNLFKNYFMFQVDPRGAPPGNRPADPGERCDIEVLLLLTEVALAYTVEHDVVAHRAEAVNIISWCSAQRRRKILSERALRSLFELCTAEDERVEIGRSAVPVVLRRSHEILRTHLEECANANPGGSHLTKDQHSEVCALLRLLADTTCHPDLFVSDVLKDPPEFNRACPSAFKPHGLCVRLLPLLAELLACSKEDLLKEPIARILKLVSSEMGLPVFTYGPAPQPEGKT